MAVVHSPRDFTLAMAQLSSSTTTKHSSSKTTKHSPTSSPSPSSSMRGSGGGLSKTTTIIIAVAASVGGIVLVFLLFRLIRHRIKRGKANPLPPVQPIAHHREQQLAQFEERKYLSSSPPFSPSPSPGPGSVSKTGRGSWYAGSRLMAPQQFQSSPATSTGSVASLLPSKEYFLDGHSTPDRQPSDISLNHEMSILPLPNPQFYPGANPSPTTSSSSIAGDTRSQSPGPPAPETPTSGGSFQSHSSIQPLNATGQQRHARNRPSSVYSNATRTSRKSTGTMGNGNSIRGAPHGPHSSVQIVLPAPLATGLSPYGRTHGWEGAGGSLNSKSTSLNRVSVVDGWAGVPVARSDGSVTERTKGVQKHASWSGLAEAHVAHGSITTQSSSSSQNSATRTPPPSNRLLSKPSSQPQMLLRPKSAPNSHGPSRLNPSIQQQPLSPDQSPSRPISPPSAFPPSFRDTPPVPRVPSIYSQFANGGSFDALLAALSDTTNDPLARGRSDERNTELRKSRSNSRSGSGGGSAFFAGDVGIPHTGTRSRSRSRTRVKSVDLTSLKGGR